MASSYTSNLGIELQATGENANTWGDKTNQNWNLIQQAVTGYQEITINNTTTTLEMTNATISNARNMVLEFTGTLTGNSVVVLPNNIEKFYLVKDSTVHSSAYTLTFRTASGTGFTLDSGKLYFAYSDGTNINQVTLNNLGGTIATAQINDNAITSAKIASTAIVTEKIADSNVTKAKIENVASYKVLGNTTATSTSPQEVAILNEVNMTSNSSTSLVTQSSVKSYVDTSIAALPAPVNPKWVTVNFSGVTSFNSVTTTFNLTTLTINGTTNNKTNLLGLYVLCKIRRISYSSNTDFNFSATFPDGTNKRIFGFRAHGATQGTSRSSDAMIFVPVNGSTQTEVVIYANNLSATSESGFELQGASFLA
jgi:hypothetical protein